jgi:hypothetical protein
MVKLRFKMVTQLLRGIYHMNIRNDHRNHEDTQVVIGMKVKPRSSQQRAILRLGLSKLAQEARHPDEPQAPILIIVARKNQIFAA